MSYKERAGKLPHKYVAIEFISSTLFGCSNKKKTPALTQKKKR